MHNLKLRAWNIHQKKYLDVYSLRFETEGIEVGVKTNHYNPTFYSADENIIELCSGKTDSEHNDIYVGDILALDPQQRYKAVVIWSEELLCFACIDINETIDTPQVKIHTLTSVLKKCNSLKIIGNIH